MKNNENANNFQLTLRDRHLLRLKKIGRTQDWLADELNVNRSYISQYFIYGSRENELTSRIEKRISREERRLLKRQVA